jgi:hypothetical protein
MHDVLASPLVRWESFYVIVGSSAAALTGLQFVVVALVAESRLPRSGGTIAAFATPTIVHFGVVLWVSALLSAPWDGLTSPAAVLASTGAAGVGYAGLVLLRARQQQGYKPVLEDWLFHALFPLVAYALVLGAALGLVRHARESLFTIGAAAVLLLFIGIHNAWDTVTYLVLHRMPSAAEEGPTQEPPEA